MDVSVAQKTDEVQRRGVVLDVPNELLPRLAFIHRFGLDRGLDQLRSLTEDPAASHRVVPDLAVAHIIVTGQSNRRAMGFQLRPGVVPVEAIESLRHGGGDRIPFFVLAEAHPVHDQQDDGSFALDLP